MRFAFGGTTATFVVTPGEQVAVGDIVGHEALLVPGIRLHLWHPDTGERVTDLLDDTGTPTDHITADEYGAVPRFRGPDEQRTLLIGQAPPEPGDGTGDEDGDTRELTRHLIVSNEWPADVDRLGRRVADLEQAGPGGGGGGESAAHPVMWHVSGAVESQRSAHPYFNLEGRPQQVTAVRVQAATITTGSLAVRVLDLDPATGGVTAIASATITPEEAATVVRPEGVEISDGRGLTVEVEPLDEADAEDVTVQVMVR